MKALIPILFLFSCSRAQDIREHYKEPPGDNIMPCLLGTGHSNMVGYSTGSLPAEFWNHAVNNSMKVVWTDGSYTTLSVDSNKMTGTGLDRIVQAKIPGFLSGTVNPVVLMANEISRNIELNTGKHVQFITINGAGAGGTVTNFGVGTQLAKGNVSFTYLTQAINAANNYAISVGKKLVVMGIVCYGGEVEIIYDGPGITKDVYTRELKNFQQDVWSAARAITGQNYVPKFYITQPETQANTDSVIMKMKQIQNDIDSRDIRIIQPTYYLSIGQGSEHYDVSGQIKNAGRIAKSLYDFEFNYQDDRVLPVSFEHTATTITIHTSARSNLQINTSNGTSANHGFDLYTSTGGPLTITSVAVSGKDIIITAPSVTDGMQIRYKWRRLWIAAGDLTRQGSAITDTDGLVYLGYSLPNFLNAFTHVL